MQTYQYEYTDTFGGEANYCWVKRGTVTVPDLNHYGYDGTNGYAEADRRQRRVIVRRVKAALGLTGHPCRVEEWGATINITPRGMATVCFVDFVEE